MTSEVENEVPVEVPVSEPHPGLKPPKIKGGLPLIGHMIDFGKNPFEFMMKARASCGELAEFKLFNEKVVLMTGPEANEAFCRAPDDQLDQSAAYRLMTPIFGKGVVFDAPEERKNEQLKILMPALRDKPMRSYAGVIAREVEGMIENWGEEGEIDFLAFTKELTLYTSSHCLLGKEFRYDLNAEFAQIYHDLEQGVQPIAYIFPYLPLPSFRQRDKARVRLQSLITGIIEKRALSPAKQEDAFQMLLDTSYKDGTKLSPHEITGMLIGAMFAGHHTSAGTAAWILIEMLRNPEALKSVRQEIDTLFGADGEVTFESLREIPHLDNTIKEVLRLHPPLIILLRKVAKDFHYRDYTVKAGKMVCISPPVSHRIPSIFKDPDRFDPNRYAPGREEDELPFAWIAFGGGRHKCSGNAFALLQLKSIFCILLRRYEFELVDPPETYKDDYEQMVVQPKQPCRIRYRRRRELGGKTKATPTGSGHAELRLEPLPESTIGQLHVVVDGQLCQGHAACMAEAPEIFQVDSQGNLTLLMEAPAPELYGKLREAKKYCPTHAITLVKS